MTYSSGGAQLIAKVTEGMHVVDSAGDEVGEVEFVRMGDAEAVTESGQRAGEPHGLIEAVAETVVDVEPDVPDEMAERLLRIGYIKVDGKGLLDTDRYVAADEIAEVADDTVRLAVPKGRLAAET